MFFPFWTKLSNKTTHIIIFRDNTQSVTQTVTLFLIIIIVYFLFVSPTTRPWRVNNKITWVREGDTYSCAVRDAGKSVHSNPIKVGDFFPMCYYGYSSFLLLMCIIYKFSSYTLCIWWKLSAKSTITENQSKRFITRCGPTQWYGIMLYR